MPASSVTSQPEDAHDSSAGTVRQPQPLCMQQQSGGGAGEVPGGVERVADDGMADGHQVHAQLVGSSGHRHQREPRAAAHGIARQHAPARQRRLARDTVDLLARAVRPVGDQGQVDLAVQLSPDQLPQLEGDDYVASVSSAPQVMSLAFYTESPEESPLSSPEVRLALNHAVNKDAIVDNLLPEEAAPAKLPSCQRSS